MIHSPGILEIILKKNQFPGDGKNVPFWKEIMSNNTNNSWIQGSAPNLPNIPNILLYPLCDPALVCSRDVK